MIKICCFLFALLGNFKALATDTLPWHVLTLNDKTISVTSKSINFSRGTNSTNSLYNKLISVIFDHYSPKSWTMTVPFDARYYVYFTFEGSTYVLSAGTALFSKGQLVGLENVELKSQLAGDLSTSLN